MRQLAVIGAGAKDRGLHALLRGDSKLGSDPFEILLGLLQEWFQGDLASLVQRVRLEEGSETGGPCGLQLSCALGFGLWLPCIVVAGACRAGWATCTAWRLSFVSCNGEPGCREICRGTDVQSQEVVQGGRCCCRWNRFLKLRGLQELIRREHLSEKIKTHV